MKDSGVAWIGEIPEHWQVVPAKAILSLRNEKAEEGDVHLTPSQKYGVLPQTEYMEISGGRVVLNLTESGQMKHVEPGDFISHLRSFQGGLELSKISGKVSGAYTVLKLAPGQHAEFWKYVFKSATYIQALQTTTDQLRDGQNIRMKELSLIPLPVPPLEEQRAIAEYLDLELQLANETRSQQLALIEKLRERKNSVVATFVTGLQNELKACSDVPWLGNYPAHWTRTRFGSAFRRVKRVGFAEEELLSLYRDYGVIPKSSRDDNHNVDSKDLSSCQLVEPGNLVINKMKAWQGSVAFSRLRGIVSPAYFVYQSLYGYDKYLHYLLRSPQYFHQYAKFSSGVRPGQWDLDPDALRGLPVLFPPIEERLEIAESIQSAHDVIDALITQAETLIQLLDERSTGIVAAAVAGKIDLRELSRG